MRTITILTAFLLLSVLPAFALGPHLYLGGSLQYDSPTGDFSGTNFNSLQGGAKKTGGAELDLGITSSTGSAYLGYRWAKHDASGSVSIPVGSQTETAGVSSSLTLNRWIAGARWHILGGLPIPITPTLGGGVSWGRPAVDARGQGAAQGLRTSKLGSNDLGWFVEGGGLLYLGKSLSLIADLQYQSFKTKIQSPLPGVYPNGTLKVSFFTFGAGLRVNLI